MTKDTLAALVRRRIDDVYDGNQAAFARKMGVSPQTVTAILQGRVTVPQTDFRRRLARELGIPHVRIYLMAGELAEDEVELPDDPRSDAVRRLQPIIDSITWNDGILRVAERQLEAIRDMQQGVFSVPEMGDDEEKA